ncbi:MAG: hypothetical protein PHC88_14990 [Terrimicrobiaceae bacterium]|nr:hypothetical protein [Terrimicrobiaceae bacterium]
MAEVLDLFRKTGALLHGLHLRHQTWINPPCGQPPSVLKQPAGG